MRAPGEAPGMVGLEIAMDELADACDLDPIELRARNEPELDPDTGLPFNQRRLLDCLREGAERFGWAERDPRPRSHHQDGWLIGTGVASATYPAFRQPGSKALIRSVASGYEVAIGAADLGTGTWTADRKSTRLNSSHVAISYAVFCLKKKKKKQTLSTH